MRGTKYRRRRLFVNRPLQTRIMVSLSWPILVALMFLVLLVGDYGMRVTQEALLAEVELPSVLPLLVTIGCFMFVAAACLLVNVLRISHAVAGPMYRIGKTLEAVRNGDPACRVRLRPSDYLHEAAGHVNDFLDWHERERCAETASDAVPSTDVQPEPEPAEATS
jgi:hypothetical protein